MSCERKATENATVWVGGVRGAVNTCSFLIIQGHSVQRNNKE